MVGVGGVVGVVGVFGDEASDADLAEVVEELAEFVGGFVEVVGVLIEEGEEEFFAAVGARREPRTRTCKPSTGGSADGSGLETRRRPSSLVRRTRAWRDCRVAPPSPKRGI